MAWGGLLAGFSLGRTSQRGEENVAKVQLVEEIGRLQNLIARDEEALRG